MQKIKSLPVFCPYSYMYIPAILQLLFMTNLYIKLNVNHCNKQITFIIAFMQYIIYNLQIFS